MTIQKQKGFTLIELVVVIVILGILAVTAAPKFIDIQDQAKTSAIKGLQGAMNGALSMTNAQAIIEGVDKEATTTILVNGATINLEYGYPATDVDLANLVTGIEDWDKDGELEGTTTTITGAAHHYGYDNFDCVLGYTVATESNGVITAAKTEVAGNDCKLVGERSAS